MTSKALKRVLVVHPYGLGDFLFVTPVLRALRLIPSVEKVDLLLGSRTAEVVRENPHVDEIFVVDKDRYHAQGRAATFQDVLALGCKLRANHYDLMLDYSLRQEYALLGRWGMGIAHTAGFNFKRRGLFHTTRLPLPHGFSGRPAVEIYSDLAERAGVRVQDRWMEFYIADAARMSAFEKWKHKTSTRAWGRFLCVSPGGGESWGRDAHFKQWPAVFFAQLCNQLVSAGRFDRVIILGSPSEKNLADTLSQQLCVPWSSFAGELTIQESAAVLANATAFAGNDGGLVHIAHALRVPLLAFYGPVDPAVYGPYPVHPRALALYKKGLECRPCYNKFRYNSACEKRECLQSFTPNEVWQHIEARAWMERLDR